MSKLEFMYTCCSPLEAEKLQPSLVTGLCFALPSVGHCRWEVLVHGLACLCFCDQARQAYLLILRSKPAAKHLESRQTL